MSIAAAIKAAGKAAAKAGGVTVTVSRGSATIEDVPATLGTSEFTTLAADGSVVTIRSRDVLILAELYDFTDGQVEPERGDQITLTEADGDHVYELLDLPGVPSWRWSDPHRVSLRLHTKEITKPA